MRRLYLNRLEDLCINACVLRPYQAVVLLKVYRMQGLFKCLFAVFLSRSNKPSLCTLRTAPFDIADFHATHGVFHSLGFFTLYFCLCLN